MDTLKSYGERGFHSGISSLGGLRKFILRGNVVDLAVGFVIGAAFSGLVQSFVKDFIDPLVKEFGGNVTSLEKVALGPFAIGDFISVLINFLIVAAVIYYFIVLPMTKFQDRFMPKKDDTLPKRDCPYCLSSVPVQATRCAFCTSQLPQVNQTATV